MPTPARFPLGAATVSALHLGTLRVRLAAWLRLDEADWPPEHRGLFAAPVAVPVQCIHNAVGGRSVLVDACHPELLAHVGDVTDVPAAPGLLGQLAAAGQHLSRRHRRRIIAGPSSRTTYVVYAMMIALPG